jgi:hypothetical protein
MGLQCALRSEAQLRLSTWTRSRTDTELFFFTRRTDSILKCWPELGLVLEMDVPTQHSSGSGLCGLVSLSSQDSLIVEQPRGADSDRSGSQKSGGRSAHIPGVQPHALAWWVTRTRNARTRATF